MYRLPQLSVSLCFVFALATSASLAQEQSEEKIPTPEMIKQLEQQLNGVKLVGQFTVAGRANDQMSKEEYTIASAKKLDKGDLWQIKARIKYGKWDLTVPLNIDIKWAGKTPVITLEDFKILGLGSGFGAHVVIDGSKYAGTWSHGDVGGHMFGTIEKLQAEEKKNGEN